MIANERGADAPDIRSEIHKDGGERAKLDHGHCRRDLFRIAIVDIGPATGEDEVSCRTDRNELGEALNYAKDDRLEKIHNERRRRAGKLEFTADAETIQSYSR